MAEEIADVIPKTSVLLLDVEGTTTSISFVKEKLFPYAAEHARAFLESRWEEAAVREAVAALRQLALDDAAEKRDGVVAVPPEDAPKEDQISGLVDSVTWLMAADRKAGPLKQLQGLIWRQGYDQGELKGHVYEDVAGALAAWRADGDAARRVFVYSSGSTEAQRMLFARSTAGDLTPHLAGHYDTAVGGKREAASYVAIAADIGCEPAQMLFLTDIIEEAKAAREAGLHVALVAREGNAPLPADVPFPVLSSLADLQPSAPAACAAKRKQDQQEDQPAKVAKASVEDTVKSTTVENGDSAKPAGGMEVETAPTGEEEKTIIEEATEIEEVTSNAVNVDASPEIEAVVIDGASKLTEDKTDSKDNKTESTKDEKNEAVLLSTIAKKTEVAAAKAEAMEAEESLPVIEDITDKPAEEENIEDTIDIDPIVEEPLDGVAVDDAEMEELQNVGDVLEKECDEILSKVNNVTNLDSITIRPLLTSINEEASEGGIAEPVSETKAQESIKKVTETESVSTPTVTDIKTKPKIDEIEKESAPKTVETEVKPITVVTETKTTAKVEEADVTTKTIAPEVSTAQSKKDKVEESPEETTEDVKNEVEGSSAERKESPIPPTTNGDAKKGHTNGEAETVANGTKLNGESNGVETVEGVGEGKVNGSSGEEVKVKAVPAAAPPAELAADA